MSEPDPARSRFLVLQVMRFAGAITAALGAGVMAGKLPSLPQEIGLPFLIVGVLEFAFVPLWLARKWKSPRQ